MQHDDQTQPQIRIAHKESFHDEVHEHDGGGQGGTEMGWLVSYADMMTLLFGLFVILFSLASKKKDADYIMKAVSAKYFNGAVEKAVAKVPSPTEDKGKEEIKEPVTEITMGVQQEKIKELEKTLETTIARSQEQVTAQEQKVQTLMASQKALQESKIKLQDKIAEMENHGSRDNSVKVMSQLKKDVESLKAQIAEVDAENQKLKEEVEKNKNPTQNYMMVLLSWETEKHDIDLQVIDPQKRKFNFKKRKATGSPGQFEIDSRYGPGIEMWKAVNFTPGDYSARLSYYHGNGNASAAKMKVSVITNLNTYNSREIVLKDKGEQSEIQFKVDATGLVQFTGAQ